MSEQPRDSGFAGQVEDASEPNKLRKFLEEKTVIQAGLRLLSIAKFIKFVIVELFNLYDTEWFQ